MASRCRHATRSPKMIVTAPATKIGRERRSILHTQNMAENLLGSSMLIAMATPTRGRPMM